MSITTVLAETERLPVHKEDLFAGLILNAKVVTPAKELLLHHVPHGVLIDVMNAA